MQWIPVNQFELTSIVHAVGKAREIIRHMDFQRHANTGRPAGPRSLHESMFYCYAGLSDATVGALMGVTLISAVAEQR